MGVFKEEVRMVEDLLPQQRRIWPDSCDIGVEATDKVKDTMRHVIKTLLPLPGSKLIWKSEDKRQYQWILRVYWSSDEYTEINVLYFKDRKKEFFSLNMTSSADDVFPLRNYSKC